MSSDIIGNKIEDWVSIDTSSNSKEYTDLINSYKLEIENIEKCGGEIAIEKQHSKGKMTARERLQHQSRWCHFWNVDLLFVCESIFP